MTRSARILRGGLLALAQAAAVALWCWLFYLFWCLT